MVVVSDRAGVKARVSVITAVGMGAGSGVAWAGGSKAKATFVQPSATTRSANNIAR
jgi:hypothetical protein